MDFIFPNKKAKYIELYDHIASLINSNVLKGNEKLPSKRDLAISLNVSINTIMNAYLLLLDEGYIYSIEKKGYFVTEQIKLTTSKKININTENINNTYKYDFTTQSTNSFPKELLKKLYKNALNTDHFLSKSPLTGDYELKQAICSHLFENRGISANISDIIISSGMESFDSLFRIIDNKNLILETPGYQKLKIIGMNTNKEIKYIEIDDEGTKIPKTDGILYTTPFNQFPTGIKMSISRKKELIEWAIKNNSYIIEDDFDAEFRINSNPTISLYSLNNERVIFFSTFSTTLYPGLKISYLILPHNLMCKYEKSYKGYSCCVSTINQLILAEMINEGIYASHINKRKKAYLHKRKICMEALDKYNIEYDHKKNYLSLLIKLNCDKSDSEIKEILARKSVNIQSLQEFEHVPKSNGIFILGYTGIDDKLIDEGIKQIADAIKK